MPKEPVLGGAQTRRDFLSRSGLLMGGLALGGGSLLTACADSTSASSPSSPTSLTLQLGWLMTNGVLGEIAAIENGYYKEAGVNVSIRPGGPNNDGIKAVISGGADAGRYSSSPRVMVAASQGLPLTAFAAGVQKHPYAYFSLPSNPVRTAQDFVGKTVGIQQTAQVLFDAVLAKNGISPKDVNVKYIGSGMTPLATGQVDVVSGWVINAGPLSVLPDDYITTLLWDLGIHLYGYPYYASHDALKSSPEALGNFLTASGRGWAWARDNIEEAVDMLIGEYAPELDRALQIEGAHRLMKFMWSDETAQNGWGTMSRQTWKSQIDTWDGLNQFQGGPPSVDDVITTSILEATSDRRPKLGPVT